MSAKKHDNDSQKKKQQENNEQKESKISEKQGKENIDTVVDYQKINREKLLQILEDNQVVENCYLELLPINSLREQTTIIRNCIIEQIDFSQESTISKIILENVHFKKEISLNSNNMKANINLSIIWKNCTFASNVHFNRLDCSPSLSFVHSSFQKGFAIDESRFRSNIALTNNHFHGDIKIKNSRFEKTFRINASQFSDNLVIDNCDFDEEFTSCQLQVKELICRSSRLHGKFNFSDSHMEKLTLEQIICNSSGKFADCAIDNKALIKDNDFHESTSWAGTRFESSSDFSGSRFLNGVSFVATNFRQKSNFERSVLTNAQFQGSQFFDYVTLQKARTEKEFLWQDVFCQGEVNFNFVDFGGRVSFSNMRFLNSVSFYRATFKGPAWFLGARFQEANFVNTTFEGQVFFSFDRNTLHERNRRKKQGPKEQALQYVSIFDGIANFTNALFYRKTVFENVFFTKFTNFQNACFAEEINFEKTHFQQGASFKGSFCSQELNFTQAVFDEYVNFDLANINRRLNLTDATMDRGISFYHAVIDVVVVERDQIEGRLIYEGMVKGQEDKKHLMRVKEEYLILKENLNQRGKFDEEDWAYYRYRVNDRKSLTQKAVHSLLNKPILAVQDDVSPEQEEKEEIVLKQVEKRFRKSQNKYDSYAKRIERIKEDLEKDEKNTRLLEQLEQLTEKHYKEENRLRLFQYEKEDANRLLEMNDSRRKKWHDSKEKPFSAWESTACLLKNSLWKIVDWGTGYGVKPFRIVFLAAAVILFFTAIYYVCEVPYPFHTKQTPVIKKCSDLLYFSAMTFATSSPEGEALAYNDKIKFYIMTEALLGVFLMALFVGCYTRKIIR